jgi:coproporphyrinogen III oxidase-like Fe-S oxidoreductase
MLDIWDSFLWKIFFLNINMDWTFGLLAEHLNTLLNTFKQVMVFAVNY